MLEKLFPDPFLKNTNREYLWIDSFTQFVFILYQVGDHRNVLKLSFRPFLLHHIKVFEKQKEVWNWCSISFNFSYWKKQWFQRWGSSPTFIRVERLWAFQNIQKRWESLYLKKIHYGGRVQKWNIGQNIYYVLNIIYIILKKCIFDWNIFNPFPNQMTGFYMKCNTGVKWIK